MNRFKPIRLAAPPMRVVNRDIAARVPGVVLWACGALACFTIGWALGLALVAAYAGLGGVL